VPGKVPEDKSFFGKDGNLSDLVKELSGIDTAIHDLLMRRAQILCEAADEEAAAFDAAAEARILRQLVARHEGALPRALLVRLWCEILAECQKLKTPLAVAVYAPEGTFGFRNLARDHFGWRTPLSAYRSAAQVFEAVRDGKALVGVLPLPANSETDNWWRNLARGGSDVPRIVARLPVARILPPVGDPPPDGVVISMAPAKETGDDRSYIILDGSEVASRGQVLESLRKAGFESFNIQSAPEEPNNPTYLVEVAGFVDEGDARLETLLESSAGKVVQAKPVGCFAVPIEIDESPA
jgi:chorismate mutase